MKKIVVLLALMFALGLVACDKDCKPGNMRCSEDTVEKCNKAGKWEKVKECLNPKKLEEFCCTCRDDVTCYCTDKCMCMIPK